MISVKDLHKSFGGVTVLDGISTDIEKGDVVCIIGPSGSGKSTFLRCLNRLETPDSGKILLDGVDLTDPAADLNRQRMKMGMVFQQFNLFPHMTVLKNLTLAPMLLRKESQQTAEARAMALSRGTAEGPNVMYFETGQGSELSSEAHFGTDQVTMEARCYGFAKRFAPFLVNTVVGFIGPEYLYDARQVTRAGLEDHFMGKLTGIPMGCDACYTNHMKADQNDIENLATLLTAAGCNYFMGIPHGDDVMLNYQTTGFRETAALREIFGLTAIPPFQAWLEKMGFVENGRLTPKAGDGSALL